MKFHKEITSIEHPVYDVSEARELYDDMKISYRTLSLMKQENIRVALKNTKVSLKIISDALCQHCGYCFKFRCLNCYTCPLDKKHKECCGNDILKVTASRTKKEFAQRHKEWCKKISLWNEKWD